MIKLVDELSYLGNVYLRINVRVYIVCTVHTPRTHLSKHDAQKPVKENHTIREIAIPKAFVIVIVSSRCNF